MAVSRKWRRFSAARTVERQNREQPMMTIRVEHAEYSTIKRAVKSSGRSINQWCKEVLLAAAAVTPPPAAKET